MKLIKTIILMLVIPILGISQKTVSADKITAKKVLNLTGKKVKGISDLYNAASSDSLATQLSVASSRRVTLGFGNIHEFIQSNLSFDILASHQLEGQILRIQNTHELVAILVSAVAGSTIEGAAYLSIPFGEFAEIIYDTNNSNWIKYNVGGSVGTETDPTVPVHVKTISTGDITNWDTDDVEDADADPNNEIELPSQVGQSGKVLKTDGTNATWQDESGVGTESDPTVPAHVKAIATTDITNWDNDLVDDADADASNELQTISKVGSTVTLSNAGGSFTDDVGITSETDPNVPAHVKTISTGDITNWDTDDVDDADADPNNEIELPSQVGQAGKVLKTDGTNATWQDESGVGTETDPTVGAHIKAISTGDITNWDTDLVDDADADASNELQTISKVGSTVTLSNGGGSFTDDDTDTQLTDEQVQDKVGFMVGTQIGITVTYNDAAGQLDYNVADPDWSGITGKPAGFADDIDNVDDADADPNNEIELPSQVGQAGKVLKTDGTNATWQDESGVGTETDPTVGAHIKAISTGDITNWDTDDVNDADADASNELQTISKVGSTVTLSDGGGSFTDDDTDTQLTDEQVQDKVGLMVGTQVGIAVTYNDVAGQLDYNVTLGTDIATAELQNDAVTTIKIADNNVTTGKIAYRTILEDDISSGGVDSRAILDNTITSLDIADNSVSGGELQDDAVSSSHIVNGTIGSIDLGTNSVGSDEIQSQAVGSSEIAQASITNLDMADDAFDVTSESATAPVSPKIGDVWLDTGNTLTKKWDGTAWKTFLSAVGGSGWDHIATQIIEMGTYGIGYDAANPGIFISPSGCMSVGHNLLSTDVYNFVALGVKGNSNSYTNGYLSDIKIYTNETVDNQYIGIGLVANGAIASPPSSFIGHQHNENSKGHIVLATRNDAGTLTTGFELLKDGSIVASQYVDESHAIVSTVSHASTGFDDNGKVVKVRQDFDNLDNHFTYVKNADSNDYGLTGFNAPENVYRIDDKTIAVAFRYNNETDPSTVLVHTAPLAVGGLVIYDISDQSKPVVLDTYKDNDLIGCMSATVHGDILYVMSAKKGTVHILDIKDRNNIVKLSQFQYETSTNTNTVAYRTDIHRSGNFLFVCGRYEASAAGKVYTIDVSDPSLPSLAYTSATLGYWTYDLRSIGNKLYVTYYGGTTPNYYSTFDINASTGVLTNQTNVSKTNADGVSNLLYGDKFVVCEWNNHVTIYDVDPDTWALTEAIQTTSPNSDDNRVDLMMSHNVNVLAFAGYSSDKVGIQIYNTIYIIICRYCFVYLHHVKSTRINNKRERK